MGNHEARDRASERAKLSDRRPMPTELNKPEANGAEPLTAVRSGAVLGITDTDRMNWLEAQQPDTLIVENGIVSSTLRGAIDEAIKRERAAVTPNE
jgi:hypothetical protein